MGSIFLCQNIFLTSPVELFPKLSTTWQFGLEIVALPTSAQWQDMELICGGLFTRQRERRERDAYVCLRPVEMFMQNFVLLSLKRDSVTRIFLKLRLGGFRLGPSDVPHPL